MSEIRDRVIKQLEDIFQCYMRGTPWTKCMNKILSIPEIAIVDRDAKLPEIPTCQAGHGRKEAYSDAQKDMLKAGWVKEIK